MGVTQEQMVAPPYAGMQYTNEISTAMRYGLYSVHGTVDVRSGDPAKGHLVSIHHNAKAAKKAGEKLTGDWCVYAVSVITLALWQDE